MAVTNLKSPRFSLRSFGKWLKHGYIFIVLAAIYIPLIFIILLSFNGQTSRGNIDVNFGTPDVTNYLTLFADDEFVNALLNSLVLGVCVTPISSLIAVFTCFGI